MPAKGHSRWFAAQVPFTQQPVPQLPFAQHGRFGTPQLLQVPATGTPVEQPFEQLGSPGAPQPMHEVPPKHLVFGMVQ